MTGSASVKRVGILTGGGDCPGRNAVIRAVTKAAFTSHDLEIFGIEDGYLGLIEDRIRPLGFDDVSNILDLGGTILGSSNKADPARYCVGCARRPESHPRGFQVMRSRWSIRAPASWKFR